MDMREVFFAERVIFNPAASGKITPTQSGPV
jgi:hypothetical protein